MEKTFLLEVVTPYGIVVNSQVEEAYIPGSHGDFGVLPGHAHLLTSLRVGEMHYYRDKKTYYLAINRGFVEVTPTKTTIITDTAERPEDIDLNRAQLAKARAEEKLKSLTSKDPEYEETRQALARAKIRISLGEKFSRKEI